MSRYRLLSAFTAGYAERCDSSTPMQPHNACQRDARIMNAAMQAPCMLASKVQI
jgi:hypothetical protein